jgi:hypothetical protein
MTTTKELDQRNESIRAWREASLALNTRPQSGDWVIFADGVERRISHVWDWPADSDGTALYSIQTSDDGSWYLGDGYASFSGGLHPGIPGDTFSDTGETRPGSVWFFHHDIHQAHNGVDTTVEFRVWSTTEVAR